MIYAQFPNYLHIGEITAVIYKDGHQKGIRQSDPDVHQLILDASDIRLTKTMVESAHQFGNSPSNQGAIKSQFKPHNSHGLTKPHEQPVKKWTQYLQL